MTRLNARQSSSAGMRSFIAILLILAAVGACLTVNAQPAELVVRIEVNDRTEETIVDAAREALRQTLLRRSGDRDLLAHPVIRNALEDARSRLSLYQFEQTEGRTRFVAQIDPEAIDNLIREADSTIWTRSRPPVLLWLVVDDVDGRRFGNGATEQPLWLALSDMFDSLGINLRRPLYDLSDTLLLSPQTLWDSELGPILEASERCDMTQLLVGKLIRLSNGRTIAEWMYRDATVEQSISVQADSREALIDPAVALAMNELRRQYAVALTQTSVGQVITVSIRNVVSRDDYRAVTEAIQSLPTLQRVRPVAVEGDTLTLELTGAGDAQTLSRLMAPLVRLTWIQDDLGRDEGLVLRWQPL